MIEQKQRFYIPCLNGWRAISILMVIVYHCAWFLFGPEGSKYDPNLWSLFKVGGYGVSIFFTISGYLITSRILEEYRQFDSFNIRDFYVKRFFRIIPPFYFYIFTIFMMNFFLPLNLSSWDFFGSLSFLRIYSEVNGSWFTGHVWSLCVEEHFYIILSFLFFALGRKRIYAVLWIWLGIIFVWNILSFRFKHYPGFFELREYLRVLSFMDYMFVGCIFAYLSQKEKKFLIMFSRYSSLIIIAWFVLFFISYPLKIILHPILTGYVIYLTSTSEVKFFTSILESRFLSFIGTISYSLYLWQQLFLIKSSVYLNELGPFQRFPLNIVVVFVIAYCSHIFLEKPFILLGRKFLSHKEL